jgi:L-threonylcarbamoyladenylate synthase
MVADKMRQGEVVAFPTETVYGLGAIISNEDAVKDIFAKKQRPLTNPLIVHLASAELFAKYANVNELNERRLALLQKFIPGPLTIILPKREFVSDLITAGHHTIALRVPNHLVAQELLTLVNEGVAAPSANPFGYISPTSSEHVKESFGEKLELILDGGSALVGLESSILDLSKDKPLLRRPGAVTHSEIEEALNEEVEKLKTSSNKSVEAPGEHPFHYSPKTPLHFLDSKSLLAQTNAKKRIARVLISKKDIPLQYANSEETYYLSEDGDLGVVAENLYATLRSLDNGRYDEIYIEHCQSKGIGEAIMNRLEKATANG